MSEVGEIKRGIKIGKKSGNNFILLNCPGCRKERWVKIIKGIPVSLRCISCCNKSRHPSGSANPNWKGGKRKHSSGYISIKLQPNDFFYPMTNKEGYIYEHRLVMAKALGRCLHRWEIVHHKNGIKDDNRKKNLYLTMPQYHDSRTRLLILEEHIREIEQRIILLEAENILLQEQNVKINERI